MMPEDRQGVSSGRMAGAKIGVPPQIGLIELFLLFSALGLSSFGGGVSAWMHRGFVERRGWLCEKEFAAALACGRIMPGTNVVNLAVLIGQLMRGGLGALAAAMGLLAGPSLVAIGLAVAYRHFSHTIALRAALEGTAVAAAGLLIAMGATWGTRVARPKPKPRGNTAYTIGAIAVMASVFVAIGVLRLPTLPIVVGVAPISIALAYFAARKPPAGKPDDRR